MRRWQKISALLITIPTVLVLLGISIQAFAMSRDASRFPAMGEMVDVGGYKLHIHCQGEGSPAVIFDSGAGHWSYSWMHIQAELSGQTRVCSHDRAGLGWSELSPNEHDSASTAKDLHRLLNNTGIEAPFILAGHSLGGANIRVYTDMYPDDVAGLVLIESMHEEQWQRLPEEVFAYVESQSKALPVAALMARVGLLRLLPVDLPAPANIPEASRDAFTSFMLQSKTYKALASEMAQSPVSAAQTKAAQMSDDLPLAVVTARRSFQAFEGLPMPLDASDKVWMELQKELVQLTNTAKHFISETATHDINFDDPDSVIEAIKYVLEVAR